MQQDQQKNLIIALILALLITFVFQKYIQPMIMPPQAPHPVLQEAMNEAADIIQTQKTQSEKQLAPSPRILIDTPRLSGSIALRGARIDDVVLRDYRETLDEDSSEIHLMKPATASEGYFLEFGWIGDGKDLDLPKSDTLWKASHDRLTPTQPVTLSWKNSKGLLFKRHLSIDENYLITIRDEIENQSGQGLTLHSYGLIQRRFATFHKAGSYLLHEGPIGVFDKELEQIGYDDFDDEPQYEYRFGQGWLGITDKYWLAALLPAQNAGEQKASFRKLQNGALRYQIDVLGAPQSLAPGATILANYHGFIGAKEIDLLEQYQHDLNIPKLELAIDFGMFYMLTKPIFSFLKTLHGWVGNFGIAILILTVLIKGLMFPFAKKSFRSMHHMRALQPEIQKMKEKYADDKTGLQMALMKLYQEKKVNPAAGCLPMLIQIPVFFALYKVLYVTIEMRHAPFFGWIQDLSAPDPTDIFNLFGTIPWDPPSILHIGIWPLIMGITMYLQQKLNPQPTDPIQAKVFTFMPIIFTFMLAKFPAGLVIYWSWNNILTLVQQWLIYRDLDHHPEK